jgi:hypothetical protein
LALPEATHGRAGQAGATAGRVSAGIVVVVAAQWNPRVPHH